MSTSENCYYQYVRESLLSVYKRIATISTSENGYYQYVREWLLSVCKRMVTISV